MNGDLFFSPTGSYQPGFGLGKARNSPRKSLPGNMVSHKIKKYLVGFSVRIFVRFGLALSTANNHGYAFSRLFLVQVGDLSKFAQDCCVIGACYCMMEHSHMSDNTIRYVIHKLAVHFKKLFF